MPDILKGWGECKECPTPILTLNRNLYECAHCKREFCLGCLRSHSKRLVMERKTIPHLYNESVKSEETSGTILP